MVTVYNQLGNGDKFRGFQIINHMKYAEARQYAKHPVACIDCRDPQKHAAKSDAVGVHWGNARAESIAGDIQGRFFKLRNTALDALMDLINDIKANKERARPDQLAKARDYQRRGQFMIDFIISENSMGFHAPQEPCAFLQMPSTSAARDRSCCTVGELKTASVPQQLTANLQKSVN